MSGDGGGPPLPELRNKGNTMVFALGQVMWTAPRDIQRGCAGASKYNVLFGQVIWMSKYNVLFGQVIWTASRTKA